MIKGFFFDLDGTLVDTHEANFLAYQNAIRTVKSLEINDELKLRIKAGESSTSFLPLLISGLDDKELSAINEEKANIYSQYIAASKLNEYLSVFLKEMSEEYVTVLVTTAKRRNAQSVLKYHNLEQYFSFMIFGDDVEYMKPHPAAYELALSKTGLDPSEVIAFEDSQKGIEAAESAGISTIHIRSFI